MVAFAPKTEPHVFNPTSAQSVDSISSEVGYSWNPKMGKDIIHYMHDKYA
jgi:hypothetical protein